MYFPTKTRNKVIVEFVIINTLALARTCASTQQEYLILDQFFTVVFEISRIDLNEVFIHVKFRENRLAGQMTASGTLHGQKLVFEQE